MGFRANSPIFFTMIFLASLWSSPSFAGLMEILSQASNPMWNESKCSQNYSEEKINAKMQCQVSLSNNSLVKQSAGLSLLNDKIQGSAEDSYFGLLAQQQAREMKCAADFAGQVANDSPEAVADLSNKFMALREARQALNAASQNLMTNPNIMSRVCPTTFDELVPDPNYGDQPDPTYEACKVVLKSRAAYQTILNAIPLANATAVNELADSYANTKTPTADLAGAIKAAYTKAKAEMNSQAQDLLQKAKDPKNSIDRSLRHQLLSDPQVSAKVTKDMGGDPDSQGLACYADARYGQGADALDKNLLIGSLVVGGGAGWAAKAGTTAFRMAEAMNVARVSGFVSINAARILQVSALGVESMTAYSQISKSCFSSAKPTISAQGTDDKGACVSAPTIKQLSQDSCVLDGSLAAIGFTAQALSAAKLLKIPLRSNDALAANAANKAAAKAAEDAKFATADNLEMIAKDTPVIRTTVTEKRAKEIESEANFQRRKMQAVKSEQTARRSVEKQAYVDQHLAEPVTTPGENKAFTEAMTEDSKKGETLVVRNENAELQNQNKIDKDFASATTNQQNKIFLRKMAELQAKNPGLEIYKYSDFKSANVMFKGKLPKDLRQQVEKAIKEAQAEFDAELHSKKIVRSTDHPSSAFKVGCGENTGFANLATRAARSLASGGVTMRCQGDAEVDRAIEQNLKETHAAAQTFESSNLGKTDLFEGPPGHREPTTAVFNLMRKDKSPEKLAEEIRKMPGHKNFSTEDARRLLAYSKNSDQFSPEIYIIERGKVSFADADLGGMSSDFEGLGAANRKATSAAVRKSDNVDEAIVNAREGEKNVTVEIDRRKSAYKSKISDSDCSGDDCGAKAKMRPWNDADKQARINALNADPATRRTRHAFFPAGVPKDDRPILAMHGESIEKDLKAELSGIIPADRLDNMTFGIDMKTTVTDRGQVGVFTGVTGKPLSVQEQQKISEALTRAVQRFNQERWEREGVPSGYWGY